MHPSIFREYDIRGVVPATLDAAAARQIGQAFGARVGGAGRICVGYDGRLSSPALKDALIQGLIDVGHRVLDIGLGPTPMLYFAVFTQAADAGVMVTGSHNPPDHNGFKFMLGKKPFFGDEIRGLQNVAPVLVAGGSAEKISVMDAYVEKLAGAYQSGSSLTIAWDAGNGAAGQMMAKLCKRLPGKHIMLNETIDGTFPAHHPDPSVAENLQQLIGVVQKNKCDAGIAFDGDGDRIGVVDDKGEILWGDQLLMLYAKDVLHYNPGATVIADVKCSQVLFDWIAKCGGRPLMWKTGHSHIKAKMQETGAKLAGEMSGHMFFADHYGIDDGLYAAVRLLSILSRVGKKLSDFRKKITLASTPEIRFSCDDARKFAVIDEIKARLKKADTQITDIDGVRVQTGQGWWLLRASNTQPVLVARAEARDAAGLAELMAELKKQLAESGISLDSPATSH